MQADAESMASGTHQMIRRTVNRSLGTNSQALLNLLGVLAVSLSWGLGGPLCWLATRQMSVADVTVGRCFFAFLGLVPFFVRDGRSILASLPRKAFVLLVITGLVLGVHFYLFIGGVAYASLATAVTLVAVEPALILLVGVVGFGERLRLESLFGIVLCIAGIFVISVLPHLGEAANRDASPRLYGDICAVAAVVAYATYYGLNRAFRKYETVLPRAISGLRRSFGLAAIIYFFATLSSGALVIVSHVRDRTPFVLPDGRSLLALIAMGLIPTLLGHTLSQVVSRKAHPIWVSLMSPGETVFALLIGALFLNQTMGRYEASGSILILFGVLLAAYSETKTV